MDPGVYDVVVCGTGIVESLLACALSQSGSRVLVVDSQEDYGGRRHGMRWEEFNDLVARKTFLGPDSTLPSEETGQAVLRDLHIVDTSICSTTEEGLLHGIVAESKRFNMELNNKLLFASGEMLEVLLHSGVYRYLEFVALDSIFFLAEGHLAPIPFSKGEIYQSKDLTMVEKRMIMKFLQFAVDWGRYHAGRDSRTLNERDLTSERQLHRPQNKKDFLSYGYDIEGYIERPFVEFLDHCRITPQLKDIIVYSLALQSHDSTPTRQALQELFLHMDSLGRYGSTAFLYPHFGSSELYQAFSRMSAVWGCTQMLRTAVRSIAFEEDKIRMTLTNNEIVMCRHLIASSSEWRHEKQAHGLVVTRTSLCSKELLPVKESGSSMLVLPPNSAEIGNQQAIFVVQHGAASNTVSKQTFVVRMSTKCRGMNICEESDVLGRAFQFLTKLSVFSDEIQMASITSTCPIWKSPFDLPSNVHLCGHHDDVLHYEGAVAEAREIFHHIHPEKVFFEKKEDSILDEVYRPELDTLETALDILDKDDIVGNTEGKEQ